LICIHCKYENHNLATFCSHCGHKMAVAKESNYDVVVKKISLFFFTLLAYIGILKFAGYEHNYKSILLTDSIFAIIVLVFFIINSKTTTRLLHFKKFSYRIMLYILILAPLAALAINYLAHFLNQNIFDKSAEIYYNQFKDSPAPLLLSIVSIGLFPAIFEEIAFRGILFNESLKIMGLKPTIFVTSILFTILHLSIISIVWIFPIGILLGYFRAKYNNLWYGIIIHFTYNSSIVLLQIILR